MKTLRELVDEYMADVVEININGEITNEWKQYSTWMVDEYDYCHDILYIWFF